MKKILISMLTVMATFMTASAQATDLSALTDAVYVEPLEAPAGSQQTLSICMKNSIEVQTIQFDLYLPTGLTVVPNEDDELMTPSKARINKFNYFESSVQTNGAIRLLAQATSTNIAVGDGEIAKVVVTVAGNMDLGDYPVSVKDILLVSKDNDSKTVEEVITMITVVEPQDSRVVLDETSTTAPEATEGAVDVRVLRTIKANEWSTICLPFAMTAEQIQAAFGENVTVELGNFTSWESEEDDEEAIVAINVGFTTVTSMEANHPYIIKVSSPVTQFEVDGVSISPVDNPKVQVGKTSKTRGYMYGTYSVTKVPEENLYLSGNKFWYSVGQTNIKAFRGWFKFYDVLDAYYDEAEADTRITMTFSDDTNGIQDNNRETITNNRYYDLQGRLVVKPGKGLYIVNGKKEMVK